MRHRSLVSLVSRLSHTAFSHTFLSLRLGSVLYLMREIIPGLRSYLKDLLHTFYFLLRRTCIGIIVLASKPICLVTVGSRLHPARQGVCMHTFKVVVMLDQQMFAGAIPHCLSPSLISLAEKNSERTLFFERTKFKDGGHAPPGGGLVPGHGFLLLLAMPWPSLPKGSCPFLNTRTCSSPEKRAAH